MIKWTWTSRHSCRGDRAISGSSVEVWIRDRNGTSAGDTCPVYLIDSTDSASRQSCDRFVLRDNVLMYFASPKEFTGFRDKPSGVVLLEECNVRAREGQVGEHKLFHFSLIHNNGEETIVLGTEYEKDMLEWMQAGAPSIWSSLYIQGKLQGLRIRCTDTRVSLVATHMDRVGR